MQRIHIHLGNGNIRIDLETIDDDGLTEDSESLDLYNVDEISSAIDDAWSSARSRCLPLLISADVVNLPG